MLGEGGGVETTKNMCLHSTVAYKIKRSAAATVAHLYPSLVLHNVER